MAVPSSGVLSLLAIYNELAENDYSSGTSRTNVSLEELSDGTVATINTNNDADDRPDGSAPHAMSEFYDYDHDVGGVQPPTSISHFASSTTSTTIKFTEPTDGTRVFYTQGAQASFTIFENQTLKIDGATNITTDENGTVFTKTISNNNSSDQIFNPTIAQYQNISLGANDFLDIKLRGRNGASGDFSSTVTHRAYTAPGVPTSLSSSFSQIVAGVNGSGSQGSLNREFHWAAPNGGASSYNIIYGSSTDETHANNNTVTGVTGTSHTVAGLSNYATEYWWIQAVGGGNDTGSLSSRQNFNGGQIDRLPFIYNHAGASFPGTQTLQSTIPSGLAVDDVDSTGQLQFTYDTNTFNDTGGEFDVVVSIISGVGSGHTFRYGASLSSGVSTPTAEGSATTLTGAFGDTVYLNFSFTSNTINGAGTFNRTCRVQIGSAFRDIIIECTAAGK